jgi:transcriptional regulator with XRE-family HTH domain
MIPQMPLTLLPDAEMKFTTELPVTVSSTSLLLELSDKTYRDSYVGAQIRIGVPFQVRALRTSRGWSQGELAQRAQMAQPRISEIEKPGERSLNIDTLLRLASAFDCAVAVSFVPFSQLVVSSESFDPGSFEVPTFQEELDHGMFSQNLTPSIVYFGSITYMRDIIARPDELVEIQERFDFNLWMYSAPAPAGTPKVVRIEE